MLCLQTKPIRALVDGYYRCSLYYLGWIGWRPVLFREDILVETEYAKYWDVLGRRSA